jgi:hypothetical protein
MTDFKRKKTKEHNVDKLFKIFLEFLAILQLKKPGKKLKNYTKKLFFGYFGLLII